MNLILRAPGHLLFLIGLLLASASTQAAPSAAVSSGLVQLRDATADRAAISMNAATEVASFVRLGPDALPQKRSLNDPFDVQTRNFLADYGSAFGLGDPETDLVFLGERTDAYGLGHARYRQTYRGIPVFGAGLSSQFNQGRQLAAISATTFEIGSLNLVPSLQQEQAELKARQVVMSGLPAIDTLADLLAINPELMIFRSGMLQGVAGKNHLVWRVEVVNDAVTVREFIFVDAHTGKILDQISGIHEALNRKVSETSLANVVWQDSAGNPDPIPPNWSGGTGFQVKSWQNEIDGARETYNMVASMTAGTWRSYNGADAIMRTVNNDPEISCPNASWNGVSTNYCTGVTGDDTVAHEWGHAYTEYTAGLIYQWQSGAMNESFSDIWGEVVDFLNGRGTDSPLDLRTTGSCSVYGSGPNTDDSYRWLSGEDDQAFGGAIRDLWHPNCYGDPGKVSDGQYWCSTGDSGGVHINSGVPNHAFALVVDGGSYNGQTITGLGLTKSAHIFWNALQMLLPASDFAQLADALETSCSSLIGTNLPDLSTSVANAGLSGESITAGQCDEVAEAIAAVQLRSPPSQCNFVPLLAPNPPERCLDVGELESVSLSDWESGIGSWTASTHDVVKPSTFDTPDWAVVASLPGERAGSAAFVADLVIGNCIADDESGALALDSPEIELPESSLVPRVSLNHWVGTEGQWDGGNIKISVNSGPFTLIPSAAIEFNPYNSSLMSSGAGNTNPLAGESAFTGSDGGSLGGSWGQSQVNLAGIADAGDSIQLRLDFGVDGCNGAVGWYVDEVEVYSCSDEFPPDPCGNGLIEDLEQCDDGDQDPGDGCSAICEIEDGWECTTPEAEPSMCSLINLDIVFEDDFEL